MHTMDQPACRAASSGSSTAGAPLLPSCTVVVAVMLELGQDEADGVDNPALDTIFKHMPLEEEVRAVAQGLSCSAHMGRGMFSSGGGACPQHALADLLVVVMHRACAQTAYPCPPTAGGRPAQGHPIDLAPRCSLTWAMQSMKAG